jgi:hypothetical protein
MLLHDAGSNCNPSIRFGASSTINLGQVGGGNTRSRVLLQFALTSDQIAAIGTGAATAASLTVTIRASGIDCSGTCPNAATTFDVRTARHGWNEGATGPYQGAGWCNFNQSAMGNGAPWQVAGADGPLDRGSIVLATADVGLVQASTAGPVEIPIGLDATRLAELVDWTAGSRLSLLLIPTGGGSLFLHSRESSPDSAQLTLQRCN